MPRRLEPSRVAKKGILSDQTIDGVAGQTFIVVVISRPIDCAPAHKSRHARNNEPFHWAIAPPTPSVGRDRY